MKIWISVSFEILVSFDIFHINLASRAEKSYSTRAWWALRAIRKYVLFGLKPSGTYSISPANAQAIYHTANPHGNARKRADSPRFRADPAKFCQNNFPADSAERPANVRQTPPDSARKRADPHGVRRKLAEEFTRKMSADKNLSFTTAPRGRTSAPDDPPLRKFS